MKETLKIILIKPPIKYNLNPKEQQPLGILYIASILRNEGYNTELLDVCDKSLEEAVSIIPKADVYGFTASFLDLLACHELAELLKNRYPDSKMIIGGHGPTSSPEYVNPMIFDCAILGEGERAVINCLSDIVKGEIRQIYRAPMMSEPELDKLPFPARELLEYQGGNIFNFGKEYAPGQSTGIISSRGCPYACSFCASQNLWQRKVRFRSIESVVAEMEHVVQNLDIFNFKFQDDTLTLNKKRMVELYQAIEELNKRYGYRIVWRCYGARVDLVDEEMLVGMKRAGCKEVDFGIETGDQYILDLMKKRTTVEQGIESIQLANKVGLDTRAFMMIGLPGTSEETADRDIEFIQRALPDAINLAIYTPYPGSDIWKNPEKYGIEIIDRPQNYIELHKFNRYNMHLFSNDPDKSRQSLIRIQGLTPIRLEKIKERVIDYIMENELLHNINTTMPSQND